MRGDRTYLPSTLHTPVCVTIVCMQVDRLSITMDPDLGKSVREAAARSGSSVSAWLAAAGAARHLNELLDRPQRVGGRLGPIQRQGARRSSAGARSVSTCSGQRRLMALVLDAGGLIAIDRLDRAVGAMLRVAQQEKLPVQTTRQSLHRCGETGRSR